jgi:hypothetical protein
MMTAGAPSPIYLLYRSYTYTAYTAPGQVKGNGIYREWLWRRFAVSPGSTGRGR